MDVGVNETDFAFDKDVAPVAQDFVDDVELVQRVKRDYLEARDKSSAWRSEAKEDYEFVAGDQWSDTDMQLLRDELRPVITFNRVAPTIDVISGLERNNRQELRYIPRETSDSAVNDTLTAAAQWVRDQCDAEDEESDAFIDASVCGMGWTETRLDYNEEPDGKIIVEQVDPLSMYWDPRAKKRNLSDAEYVINVKDLPLEWIKAEFPDRADQIESGSPWRAGAGDDLQPVTDMVVSGDNYAEPDSQSGGPDQAQMVRVVHYQYRSVQVFYRALNPVTNAVEVLKAEAFEKILPTLMARGVTLKYARMVRYVHRRALVTGDIVLHHGDCEDVESFGFKCITCKRDKIKGQWYGYVRPMKDPQRWANKWLSQSLHIINSNAKGGVIAEKSAIGGDIRKVQETWAKPNAITLVEDGALTGGRIQPKQPPQYPQAMAELLQFAIQSIRDVNGVNIEMLGQSSKDVPASLEYQRKQSVISMLAPLFDSLRKYRKMQGRTLANLIRRYLSDGRLIRILGKENSQPVRLVKQPETVKYDVIVDEAPTSPNQKEQVWAIMQTLIPLFVQSGVAPPVSWLEYLPLPDKMIAEMKEQVQKPNPQQQEQQQMAKQALAADIQEKQASAAYKMAQAQTVGQKAQADIAARQVDLQAKQMDAQVRTLAVQRESAEDVQQARENEISREVAHLKAQVEIERLRVQREELAVQALELQARRAEATAKAQTAALAASKPIAA